MSVPDPGPDPGSDPGGERVLIFAAAGQALAIDAGAVAEVVALPPLTRVPHAPRALAGLANLRGRVVPILAMDALLGRAGGELASRVILLDGADPLGLAVQRVTSMGQAGDTQVLDLEQLLAGVSFTDGARPQRAGGRQPAARAEPIPQSADVAFLEFQLAGQAYGLPLEQVREVAALPENVTALPHTDAAMIGVIPVRGELVALVALRAVLGLPAAAPTSETRVVLVSVAGASLALMVDKVSAILRADARDVGAAPAVLNRGAGEARIDAIVRRPGGLVSVLAVERILHEDSIAQIIAEGAGRGGRSEADREDIAMEQFILFRLGRETYGLPVAAVIEVVRLPEQVTRAPRAPDFVAGLMNHRGSVVPLVDQCRRFGAEETGDARHRRIVVARVGDLTAGFIVDAVEQILSVPAEDLQATPQIAETPVFDRVATVDVDGRMVLLVDPRQLLDQAERDIVRELAERSKSEPA
jgi:purine-binding chemotaxis protein CheW